VTDIALRVASVVEQFTQVEVYDVVGVGRVIQMGGCPHAIGNGVIRTRRISAHPQPTDHLPVRIEWNATAECDDATGDAANCRSLWLESRIERIGIVQTVERTGGEANG
jgi:hypothetical protein